MLSNDETIITHMEAALKKAKADKVAKAEQWVAEERQVTEAKAVEECRVAEVKAAEECRITEVKAREEERSRAQAEALRQEKLLAALEAKQKAKVASGSRSGLKGSPKDVRAPEKGKGVEQTSCDHCTARGVICEVSPYLRVRSDSELTLP